MKNPTDYYYTDQPDVHIGRRKKILEEFPEIEDLYGTDIRNFPITLAFIGVQLCMAYYQRFLTPLYFMIAAYAVGGTINNCLGFVIHEATHHLIFETPVYNKYLGMACNIAMAIPNYTLFQRYHLDHHVYTGVLTKDVDIATPLECRLFQNPALKICWLVLFPFLYTLRPIVVYPKKWYFMDYANVTLIAFSNSMVVYFTGYRGLMYLLLSTFLGLSVHPTSGHFIAEHYVVDPTSETNSYYGPLNRFSWNIGYHNEHHDFPKIPCAKLPMVTQIANKYYAHLYHYTSLVYVLYNFVMSPVMGPSSRIVRQKRDD